MLLVVFLAPVGYGSAAEDNIGQGLSIDGPGGYLPDSGYINGEPNSNTEINYEDIWSITSYWDDLFHTRDFSFWF